MLDVVGCGLLLVVVVGVAGAVFVVVDVVLPLLIVGVGPFDCFNVSFPGGRMHPPFRSTNRETRSPSATSYAPAKEALSQPHSRVKSGLLRFPWQKVTAAVVVVVVAVARTAVEGVALEHSAYFCLFVQDVFLLSLAV